MKEEHFWNPLAKKLSGNASAKEKYKAESLLNIQSGSNLLPQHPVPFWASNKTGHCFPTKENFQTYGLRPRHDRQETIAAKPASPIKGEHNYFFFCGSVGFLHCPSSIEALKPLFKKATASACPTNEASRVQPCNLYQGTSPVAFLKQKRTSGT